jgi:isopenicillin N synthase-like dioxygenase
MVQYLMPVRGLQPVLDISTWQDGSDKPGVVRQFDRICREIGFFYLAGHGIETHVLHGILAEAERFFAQPQSLKMSAAATTAARGYEPLAAQALDVDSPGDLKESYQLGMALAEDHPFVISRLPNYGANRWPGEEVLPGFRAVCETFHAHMLDLSATLMAIFATAADLPEDYFAPQLKDPMATLRLLHYPPQPANAAANQIGCGAHTDWGAFTILLQDETGGLEVQGADGEWLFADPLPGTFVVNLGDMMPVWTNGAYYSNPHRVRNRSPHKHRYSVPFFQDLNYYTQIKPLPAFQSEDGRTLFEPRTAGEHFEYMYRKTREAVAEKLT